MQQYDLSFSKFINLDLLHTNVQQNSLFRVLVEWGYLIRPVGQGLAPAVCPYALLRLVGILRREQAPALL